MLENLFIFLGWTLIVTGGTWYFAANSIIERTIDMTIYSLANDGLIKLVKHNDGSFEVKKAD